MNGQCPHAACPEPGLLSQALTAWRELSCTWCEWGPAAVPLLLSRRWLKVPGGPWALGSHLPWQTVVPHRDFILAYVPHSTHRPAGCPWCVLDGPSAFPYQAAACQGARGKGPLETGLGFC